MKEEESKKVDQGGRWRSLNGDSLQKQRNGIVRVIV